MKREKLNKILENHQHWLNRDCEGWDYMRADLYEADLRKADLRGTNLCNADLRNADLRKADPRGADLCEADLRYADLRGTNLCGAELRYADLRYADLRGTNLCGADLCGADFSNADLRYADLRNADLRCTNLYHANLYNADLRGAKTNHNVIAYTNQCPQEGSFIAFKKCDDKIVKLKICEDAKRSNATTNRCRCDKAEVLGIYDVEHNLLDDKIVASDYDEDFIYEVGKIISVDNFDEDRWNECSTGIHFFLTFEMAVIY